MNEFGSIHVREGDVVGGKYRIERLLGVGGMGVVVAARHEQLDQLVAIKFIRDDALDNDEAVERFLREARSAARLKSEHVARVLDVGRLESGAPYMVMEFLEGHDLAHTLTHDGPLAADLAAALMVQVCEAVAEAHAAGIVHRDLKPENLFLTRTVGGSPKMKVLDFGVSKSARLTDDPRAKLTRTRTMLGSPLYMAPEQMRSSRDVDARGDVWALGVVLFELLTARSPFDAETMPDLCIKIISEPPLSLAELRPAVPPGLVEIVERCLEKDRNKRYDNAAELALALAPFVPARSSVYSLPAPGSVPGALPVSLFSPPIAPLPASVSGAPSGIASIPAAWGTEGRRESQQAPARRRPVVAWVVVGTLAVGAAMVAVAISQRSTAPASRASETAPGATSIGSAIPEALPLAVDLPPPRASDSLPAVDAVEAIAPSVEPPPLAAPSSRTPPPRSTLAMPAAPRPARPVATASSTAGAKPDDDIPSLR
ncbi:MAG TPA: protein kinase [Polyangiaceae bacterium]|nr:protein kinase [Polyangiaceae bacterium]